MVSARDRDLSVRNSKIFGRRLQNRKVRGLGAKKQIRSGNEVFSPRSRLARAADARARGHAGADEARVAATVTGPWDRRVGGRKRRKRSAFAQVEFRTRVSGTRHKGRDHWDGSLVVIDYGSNIT